MIYGFTTLSTAYIYDTLQFDNKDTVLIDRRATMTDYELPESPLVFKDVDTLISWLGPINQYQATCFVSDTFDNLNRIKDITIYEDLNIDFDNKEYIEYEVVSYDYTQELINESTKDSLFSLLNPLLYKQSNTASVRNDMLREIGSWLFKYHDFEKFKAGFNKYVNKKMKSKFERFYNFVEQHKDIIDFCKQLKDNNWNTLIKKYPDVKTYEIKYLKNVYDKVVRNEDTTRKGFRKSKK